MRRRLIREREGSRRSWPSGSPPEWSLRAARYRWAELLRRLGEVDALACQRCRGPMRMLAVIADPVLISRILVQRARARDGAPPPIPESPAASRPGWARSWPRSAPPSVNDDHSSGARRPLQRCRSLPSASTPAHPESPPLPSGRTTLPPPWTPLTPAARVLPRDASALPPPPYISDSGTERSCPRWPYTSLRHSDLFRPGGRVGPYDADRSRSDAARSHPGTAPFEHDASRSLPRNGRSIRRRGASLHRLRPVDTASSRGRISPPCMDFPRRTRGPLRPGQAPSVRGAERPLQHSRGTLPAATTTPSGARTTTPAVRARASDDIADPHRASRSPVASHSP